MILVDEKGNVIEADAFSGHNTLRKAAETAARQARFGECLMSGEPMKCRTQVTYNFLLD